MGKKNVKSQRLSSKETEMILTKDAITNYRLNLAPEFVKAHQLDKKELITFIGPDGQAFEILFRDGGRLKRKVLGKGWDQFVKAYKLEIGNKLNFDFIQKHTFCVHIGEVNIVQQPTNSLVTGDLCMASEEIDEDSLENRNESCRSFIGRLSESLAVWGDKLPVEARVAYSKMAEEICDLLVSDLSEEDPNRETQLKCFETALNAPLPEDLRSTHLQDAVTLFSLYLSETGQTSA